MSSKTVLIGVQQAQERLLEKFSPLEFESLPLTSMAGRILAEDVVAPRDVPEFSNSAMDGFAIRSQDVGGASPENPVRLTVIDDIAAGCVSSEVIGKGQAARIMTGAPVPDGADAVVPVEATGNFTRDMTVEAPKYVDIYTPVIVGAHIRRNGEDLRAGEVVLTAGTLFGPAEIGFLSMLGIVQAPARRKPRVAVFSTGDELMPVGAKLEPGKVYDANSNMLLALVEQYGGEGFNLGIIPDEQQSVKYCLEQAAMDDYDLLISSAGVSVGAFDFVRKVVEEYGRMEFWRVNMRPGKPFAFGYFQDMPLIGLPGNPVSAYVGFQVFVRPVLKKMQGWRTFEWSSKMVQLAEDVESDGREAYLRIKISNQDDVYVAYLAGHQGSGNLRSLVEANALLFVPSGVKFLKSGSIAKALMMNDLHEL